MKARAVVAATAALALGACSAWWRDNPADDPIAVIDGSQIDQYWIDRSPYAVGAQVQQCEPGVVVAEYTIGSDGRVYNVDIVRSRPMLPRNEVAVKDDLWPREYDPSPSNPQHYSVRVHQEFTVDCGPGKPKWN